MRKLIVTLFAVGLVCGSVVAKDKTVTLDNTDPTPQVIKQEAAVEATAVLTNNIGVVAEVEKKMEVAGENRPTGNQAPDKGYVAEADPRVQEANANSSRVEGDTCVEAYVVAELPYNVVATTVDNTDTYGRANPDEWYMFTALEAAEYAIYLCNDGTDFDTYLYLLADDCATVIMYDDDGCWTTYSHSEFTAALEPGDYYVCVEGYSVSGNYELTIEMVEPCVVECPPEAIVDTEPTCYDEYVDITNGGCDSDPAVFGAIECGQTICGTAGTYTVLGTNTRDTDWYQFELTEDMTVTWSVEAEFAPYIKLVNYGDCTAPVTIAYAYGIECDVTTVSAVMYPGLYAAYVSPDAFTGIPCDADFWGMLTCEPYTIPVGANCASPVPVSLPMDLPYTDLAQTTCGMLHDYDDTDMGYYDGGEDIIYEFTVTEAVTVDITMDPGATTYSGIGLFNGCPDAGVLLYQATASAATPRELESIALAAGTYYFMVDTWTSPDCIPSFDLTITDAFCDLVCPPESVMEGEEICYDEYVDAYNGGCDMAFPAFSAIDCGATVCGTAGTFLLNAVETRDTDWYHFTLLETNEVVWTGAAEFNVTMALVSGVPACDPEVIVMSGSDGPCDVVTLTTILPAGDYAAFIAPTDFTGVFCGSEYYATLTCTPWTAPLGDYCINPYLIESLPYSTIGTTEDNTDTYGGVSLDEWYQFTLDGPALVTVELCGPDTGYDTYLRLVAPDCTTEIAYDDDGPDCPESDQTYAPSEVSLELEPGTYNVCVEGYSDNFGIYNLDIHIDEPCVVECPGGSTDEGEVVCYDEYVDVTNGGCNSDPFAFGAIANGETICGTSGTYTVVGSNYRDTDWFLFDLIQTSEVSVTCEAEFPLYLTIASGVPACPSSNVVYDYAAACEILTVGSILDPGTYAVFVAPNAYSGIACGKPYYVTLNHTPWVPPVGDTCADPLVAPCLPYQAFSTTANNTDTFGNLAPDEWTRFTLEEDAHVLITLCGGGTSYDSYLRLLADDCITELEYNDDACGLQSEIETDLLAGTYVICVEGYSSNSGDYQLDIIVADPTVQIQYIGGNAVLTISGGVGAAAYNIYKSLVPYDDGEEPAEFVLFDTVMNGPGDDTWTDPGTGSYFYYVTAACTPE